jgi:hypothetical protein
MCSNTNKLRKFIVKVLNITPGNLIYFVVFAVTDIPTFLLVAAYILTETTINFITKAGYNLPPAIINAHQRYLYVIFFFGLFYHFLRFIFDKRFSHRKVYSTVAKLVSESHAINVSTIDRSRRGIGIRSTIQLQVGEIYKLNTPDGVNWGVIVWYDSRKKKGGFLKLNNTQKIMMSSFAALWRKLTRWVFRGNQSESEFKYMTFGL